MFEPSKELQILKGFIQNLPKGSYITYEDIAKSTSIKMNERGKNILRSAFRSCGLEYYCDRGKGVEIESDKNAMQLVTGRVKRVSNGLKRASKTTMRMTERYVEKLSADDRNRLLATASLFGAINAMAKGLGNIYKPKTLNTVAKIEIPKFD